MARNRSRQGCWCTDASVTGSHVHRSGGQRLGTASPLRYHSERHSGSQSMSKTEGTSRREFLQWSAVAGASAGAAHHCHASGVSPSDGVRAYRRLGRTGMEISDISFGSSRLRDHQASVVRFALDQGINYFDTAESYTGGTSETVLGTVLKGKRDKIYLTTKKGTRPDTTADEMMRSLDGSLRRLQTDYVDVFMTHAVNEVERLKSDHWLSFVEQAKQQGKIRFAGMSGHAGRLAECLEYALDEDMVDVILVAFNFGEDPGFISKFTKGIDWIAKQPELPRLLAKAKAKDVGVTVMKTLRGARLNDMRPYEAPGGTFAQAAFRWVLSHKNVDAVIITMSSEDQIREFLGASGTEGVAANDIPLLRQYMALNDDKYCRPNCGACLSACDYGVPISDVLRMRMYAVDYGDLDVARKEYAGLSVNAQACLSCSATPCQSACVHGLAINELSVPAHRLLT